MEKPSAVTRKNPHGFSTCSIPAFLNIKGPLCSVPNLAFSKSKTILIF